MTAETIPALSWESIRPHLDEALASLPAKQRRVVILRCLYGRPEIEIARELGCPASTVSMRLKAGLERLKDKLCQRGIVISAAILAVLVGENAVQAAPAGLVAGTQALALGGGAAAAGSAAAIADAAWKGMVLAKVKAAVLAGAACLAVAVGVPAAVVALTSGGPGTPPAAVTPAPVGRASPSVVSGSAKATPARPAPAGSLSKPALDLAGHEQSVAPVAFSPDGRRFLSGGGEGTLKIWDARDGRCLMTLSGHEGALETAFFAAGGRRAVSSAGDGTVRVWDLEAGKLARTIRVGVALPRAVAVSPDGKAVLVGESGGQAVLRDLESGRELRRMTLPAESLAFAFHPGGGGFLAGGEDGVLRLADLEEGEVRRVMRGHQAAVRAVAFLPGGKRALTGSWDGTLRLWDLGNGQCLAVLRGHGGMVAAVAVSPDGRRGLSAGWDGTARLWDLEAARELGRLAVGAALVNGVAFSHDGRRAITSGRTEREGGAVPELRLWNIPENIPAGGEGPDYDEEL